MSKINDLKRICVSLESDDKSRRRNLLQQLHERVIRENWTSEEYLEIWETLKKQLSKSLTDEAEFCRNTAIDLWQIFLAELPSDEKNIVGLMTILSRRLSCQELLETSEEVRLNCVKLLRLVVEKYRSCLAAYYDDFVAIAARTVIDNYPAIKRESCCLIEDLATSKPEQFYSRATTLVKPSLTIFTHQHWKVRVAGVRAIGQILLNGNSKSMEDIATPMAERLFDQSAAVRRAVVEVAGNWLLELKDRYSWWHKLLPLLVTGLHDEIEEIRNLANDLWDEVGQQYAKENENDEKFKDKLDFLIEDPVHYPPHVQRPNIGCRTIVQQNLCKLVAGISRELGDWLADIRVRSAQLLCVLVLNAEEHVTQHIEKLLPGMYRACQDDDPRVVTNVETAAEYMGYFVPPSIYCDLVLPTMEENLTAGHLRVFAAILRGSQAQSLSPKLLVIGQFIQQPHVCRSKKSRHQKQLARCCESLIKVCKNKCVEISQQLFTVLFTLVATCQTENPRTLLLAEELLKELATIEEISTLDDLYLQHLRAIMNDLSTSSNAWTIHSTEFEIFSICLTRAAHATSQHMDVALPILRATMSNNSDPRLRLKLFILLADYFQQRNRTMRDMRDVGKFVNAFLGNIVLPGLVWTAGRTAEAIRTATIACLCAMLDKPIDVKNSEENRLKCERRLEKSSEENEESSEASIDGDLDVANNELFEDEKDFSDFFNKLVPIIVSLIDDNSKKTRLYALRAVYSLVGIAKKWSLMNDDRIHEIYPVVLKRLDDGCDDVRIGAIEALVAVWTARMISYDIIFSRSHVDYLYTTAIVHLDDPDEKFQALVLDALVQLSTIHPELLATKIVNSKGNFRNQIGLDVLLTHCHENLGEK